MSEHVTQPAEKARHEIVHRNPIGEAVCSCGELFEHGTLSAFWDSHIAASETLREGRP